MKRPAAQGAKMKDEGGGCEQEITTICKIDGAGPSPELSDSVADERDPVASQDPFGSAGQ